MKSVHTLVYSRERGEEQIETAQGSGPCPAVTPVCVLVPSDLEQLPGRAMACCLAKETAHMRGTGPAGPALHLNRVRAAFAGVLGGSD